ncbi:MAG: phosphoribosylaminoimidazolesuccinocarboxamide synthase [Microcella sp.]|uniref:phosphoribosylaminoimidazolesuccinocarboxamide synthase n=1 Tax=Microcella sp. TaxID=1913979 RepID=UPI00331465F0
MADAPATPGWTHVYSGKVRDLYEHADHPALLLVIASDRVSAFDHVLEPGIPGKGALLTQLTRWWFGRLAVPNHLAVVDTGGPTLPPVPAELADRAMLVKRLDMLPIECVVRGYLTGSGWAEYRESGTVCGIPLPAGLRDGDRLPGPLYTPAFKAPLGEHDENITFERSVELVGLDRARQLRDASLAIFAAASSIAAERGLLLADTKVEFGADPATGVLTLGDEVLTSDSSRYWDAELYAAGGPSRLDSFDKQIVRDWLAAHWNKQGTPPALPPEIVERTAARYRELLTRLTA